MVMNKIILGFVTLILGVALLSQVAITTQSSITTRQTTTNDTIDVSSAKVLGTFNSSVLFPVTNLPTGWKSAGCPLADIAVRNSSGVALTVTTEYVLTPSTGYLAMANSSAFNETVDNQTRISYTYCANDYINLGWGRTLINLVTGFFAIALLLVSIGIFYSIARETGLVNA